MEDRIPTLELKDLTVYHESFRGISKIIDGVDLMVRSSESVGLVGESGCGKTLTAKMILRLLPFPPFQFVRGKVRFEGRDLLAMNEREMESIRGTKIALIPQSPMTSLNPVFTVGDQMADLML